MQTRILEIITKFLLIVALGAAISACGRRGNLELPPSSNVIIADDNGEVSEAPEKEDKPFILDGLL